MTVYTTTDKYTNVSNNTLYDFELSLQDVMVYYVLSHFANNKTHKCHPSRKKLSKFCRIGIKSVDKALKHLEELGYIQITHRYEEDTNCKMTHLYTVITEGVYHEVEKDTSEHDKAKEIAEGIEDTEGKEIERMTLKETRKDGFVVQDVTFKATEREYNNLKKVRKVLKKKSSVSNQDKAESKVVSLHSYVDTQKKEQKENTAHDTSDEVVNGISPTCTLDQNGFPSVKEIMRKRMYRQ